jgi:hypothetical protein
VCAGIPVSAGSVNKMTLADSPANPAQRVTRRTTRMSLRLCIFLLMSSVHFMIVLSVMRPRTYQLLCGRYILEVWSRNFANPTVKSILSERPSVGLYRLVANMAIGSACNGRQNKLTPPRVRRLIYYGMSQSKSILWLLLPVGLIHAHTAKRLV